MKANHFTKCFTYTLHLTALAASFFCASFTAKATVLFSDNFDTDTSAQWTINYAPTANASTQQAQFAFDYSVFGIPPAPGSTNTLGLRLRSNIPIVGGVEVTTRPAGATSGLSISPTGKNFGSSYHLSFYCWVNFNGAPNASGLADNANSEGGTHNVFFAVGTSGTVPMVVGNTGLVVNGVMDGIGFATTGDGGITSDYRAYLATGTISTSNSGVYQGESSANNAPFYESITELAPHSAPTIQQSLSTAEYSGDAANTQAGSTQIGAFGFAWHKVDIFKVGNCVSWYMDDTELALASIAGLTLGGSNIALGDSDVNSTTTRHPSLLFSLFDNLVVTDVTNNPTLHVGLSGTNLNVSWDKESTPGFVLQLADSLTAPVTWTNFVGSMIANSNTWNVSLPASATKKFFRLKQ